MRKLSFIILPGLALTFISVAMTDPNPHGKDFRISCNVCHSSKGWMIDPEIYSFDHGKTVFPLTGQHAQLNCRSCHPTLVFAEAKTNCVDCHTDLHDQTVGPDCERCHTTRSWVVENITQIHQMGRFPLTGPHLTADCQRCHPSASLLRFDPVGVECFECHKEDYNAATKPNHIQSGYSTDCIICHSANSFTWSSNVDHSFFPLTLGHAIGDCNQCHVNGSFSGLSTECVSCHLDTYNATSNPNHTTLNFQTNCIECHTTNPGWRPANIDHGEFPLTLGHDIGDCNKCHNGNYNNTPNECVSCHLEDYNGSANPNHVAAGFPNTCDDCHNTNPGWKPATFDHTSFPLTLGHNISDCNKCHNGNYNNTPNECVSCHLANYNGTTNPNHVAAGFPNTCADCHNTNPGWKPATFDHTSFPLTLGHDIGDCNKCHNGNYNNTPNECVSCHLANYNGSTNPNHSAIGVPNTCADCHTTNPGWKPATFSIHNNYYVIQGAHVAISNDCVKCHNGNYNSTPNTCEGCHMTDYNTTTNPPHASAQFPTNCESCHTQSAWVPSTFNHDGQYFPIYSGKHQGEWNLCADCHTNPTNYAVFSCIDCHEHNKTDMDDKHNDVPGYSWNSQACYTCHPTGTGAKMLHRNNIDQKN